MDCELVFSVHQLNASSYINENFILSQCMPNTTKLAVFSISVLIWLCILVFTSYLLAKELTNKTLTNNRLTSSFRSSDSSSFKSKVYLLIMIAAVGELCSYGLMMSATQNPVRYLIYAISQQCIRIPINRMSLRKFNTALATVNDNVGINDSKNLKRKFEICIRIRDSCTALVTLSCCIIGPIISYHYGNYVAVNWFYAIRMSATNVVAVILSSISIYTGNNLIRYCSGEITDGVVDNVLKSTSSNVKIAKILLVKRVIFSFFFLRMIWNLEGVFWYHFVFYQLGLVIAVSYSLWTLTRRGLTLSLDLPVSDEPSLSLLLSSRDDVM